MPHDRGRADRCLDLRIDLDDLPCDSAYVSEGAFIVAIIAVSVTFFATAGGALWALASRLSSLAQKVESQAQQIVEAEAARTSAKAELEKVAEALRAEVRSVRDEAQGAATRLTTAAEVRRTEDVARWLSFTEKLATITGLLSAHPNPR